MQKLFDIAFCRSKIRKNASLPTKEGKIMPQSSSAQKTQQVMVSCGEDACRQQEWQFSECVDPACEEKEHGPHTHCPRCGFTVFEGEP